MSMHKNSKLFFDNHPTKNEFWYTVDGKHFFTEAGATAHAASLKKNKGKSDEVCHVTRAEVLAGESDGEKKQSLEEAQAELTAAQAKLEAAIAEKNGLPADAKAAVKTTATKKVAAAQKEVDALTSIVAALQASENGDQE